MSRLNLKLGLVPTVKEARNLALASRRVLGVAIHLARKEGRAGMQSERHAKRESTKLKTVVNR